MIIFTQMVILISMGYVFGVFLAWLRDRNKKIKYYILESTDGHRYEIAYANRDDAVAAARELAYSGSAYEHVVGGGRKLAFVW